jgi:hypothetical protein
LARRSYRLEQAKLQLVHEIRASHLRRFRPRMDPARAPREARRGLRAPTTGSVRSGQRVLRMHEFQFRLEEVSAGDSCRPRHDISTRMACTEPAMTLESSYLAELSVVDRYTF